MTTIELIKRTEKGTELFKWAKTDEPTWTGQTWVNLTEGGIFALAVRDGFFVRLQVISGAAPHFSDIVPLVMERWSSDFTAEVGTRNIRFRLGMSGCIDVEIVTPLKWDEEIYIKKQNASLHVSCAGKLNEGANCPAVCFAVAACPDARGLRSDAVIKERAVSAIAPSPVVAEEETPAEEAEPEEIVVEDSEINEIRRWVDDVPQHKHDGCEYWHPVARVHKEG